jgi:hypothetical protein
MRLTLLLLVIGLGAQAQVKSYKLADVDNASLSGAGVAISPRNNKNIVAYAGGKIYASNDAGATWKTSPLQLSAGIKGTPKVTSDAKGNFFIVYSTFTQLLSQYSTDDGQSWSEPVVISTVAGRELYNPGVGTHPKKEELLVTWTQSGKVGSETDTCKSMIMMSTSGNGGKKWSKPIVVNQKAGNCIDEDFTVRGSTPLAGADGKKFVVWAGQGAMFYDRTYDGDIWISTDLPITEQVGGWTMTMPGFGKVANTPVVAIDNSASRIHGTLFLAYSDLESGDSDADVWLARSVNRGDNWTSAARINQDKPGRHQFLPRISIDPSNGYVYVVYYDRRDGSDNQTDVYLAWSTDGGNQFKEKKLTETPFVADINSADYLSDFIDLSVQKGLIVPVWTASENGKQQVWTAVVKHEDLVK